MSQPASPASKPAENIRWDANLIARYDLSGPRYTSYPTAPQFHGLVSSSDIDQALQRSNQSDRALSIYTHIPFCDTVCYYCACNKIITANKSHAILYLQHVITEMKRMAPRIDQSRRVDQLHWGGGTPTYLSLPQMTELMTATQRLFNLHTDDSGEYAIEIHPRSVDGKTLKGLRALGFNRLSIGVQDFDAAVQKAVNRFNSVEEVTALIDAARSQRYHSISMDLIYGLPMQTMQSIATTLQTVIGLAPDRLSLFNYAHMPHLFKVQKQIDSSCLPAGNEKLDMFHYAIERLTEAGYVHIGMDHFAKPDDELALAQRSGHLHRNFQGYATRSHCDLLAFGVSSISHIDNLYLQNHKQLSDYYGAIENDRSPSARGFIMSDDDQLRSAVIMQLICHFELNFAAINARFGIEFTQYFAKELARLAPMCADGLVSIGADKIIVNPVGRLLIRRICMVFDAYLEVPNAVNTERGPATEATVLSAATKPALFSKIL